MAIDYARLKSILANSKIQRENNALYQTILGTIQAAEEFQVETDTDLEALLTQLSNIRAVYVVEADTSTAPVSYELSEYLTIQRGMVVFKDISGNASVNNITLTGTVEGVVDPVINTNYGIYRAYLGITDGLFYTW